MSILDVSFNIILLAIWVIFVSS